MSLSEMSKATYRKHATSIRANGVHHAIKWIECPLEREDMRFLLSQSGDHLAQRKAFACKGEFTPPSIAFLLTTPFTK